WRISGDILMCPFGRGRALEIAFASCLLMLILTGTRSANAQRSASLNGTVKDTSGAVVPAADITLTNTGTGVAQTKVSSGSGLYSFLEIPPGNYTLQASKNGLRQYCSLCSLCA